MSVGEAWIDVTADGSGLPAQVKAMCERAGKWAEIEAHVDLDTKGLIAEVKALAKTASEAATVEYEARLDASRLRAQARALAATPGGTIKYKTEIQSLYGKVGALTREANKRNRIQLQAEVDFAEVNAAIAREVGKAAFDRPIEIPAKVDTSLIDASLKKSLVEAAVGVEVPVDLDLSDAAADMAELQAMLNADRGLVMQMRIDPDRAQMNASIDSLRAQLAAHPVEIPAQVEVDRTTFTMAERFLQQRPLRIPAEVDFDALQASVSRGLAEATVGRKIEVPVDFDVSGVDAWAARAFVGNFKIPVEADPNLRTAIQARTAMQAVLLANPVEIPVEANIRTLRSSLAMAFARLRSGGSGIAGFASDIGDMFKSLGNVKFINAAVVTMRFAVAQFAIVAALAAVAYPAVKALGVAFADIALQAGAAASALGAFAVGGIVSIGVAAATTKIGVMGLSDSFDELGKVWAKLNTGTKLKSKDWKDFEKSLKGLAPSARSFMLAIRDMYPGLRKLQQGVQQSLFAGLGKQITKTAKVDLPVLQRGFESVAQTLNGIAVGVLTWARSQAGVKALNDVFRISNTLLGQLASSAGNVGKGLLTLFVGSERSFSSVGGMIEDLTKRFSTWANEAVKSGTWDAFLRDGEQALRDIGGVFKGTGTVIGKFWSALRGEDGKNPLTSLATALQGWADNLSVEDIKQWVGEARAQFEVLKQDISTMWSGLTTGLENVDEVMGFFNDIREQIGLIEETGIDWQKVFTGKRGWRVAFADALASGPGSTIAGPLTTAIASWFDSVRIDWTKIFGPFYGSQLNKMLDALIPDRIEAGKQPEVEIRPKWKFTADDPKKTIEDASKAAVEKYSMGNFAPNDPITVIQQINLETQIKEDNEAQAELDRRIKRLQARLKGETLQDWSMGGVAPSDVHIPTVLDPPKNTVEVPKQKPVEIPVLPKMDSGALPTQKGIDPITVPVVPYWTDPKTGGPKFPDLTVPVIPEFEPGSMGGFAPSIPPITVPIQPGDAGGFMNLGSQLTGMVGDVTVPIGYGPLPNFPTLPSPKVTVGTGYAHLPNFPTLPKPKVTIGLKYGPVPAPPHLPTLYQKVKLTRENVGEGRLLAKGAVFAAPGIHVTKGPEVRIIGEAGSEAVVPLSRTQPLDPGVAALLRQVALGKGWGVQEKTQPVPTVGVLQVVSPTDDPEATAMAVVNRIAAKVG